MANKPTELRLGNPEPFDGSPEKAEQWLNTVRFYLSVNASVYDSDAKQIAFALSHMTKGAALVWADTFRQQAVSAASINFGTFVDFCTNFKSSFVLKDTIANV